MPSSTARSTTRRCSAGLPRTMSPAFPPQPKPISETRSSVFPICRYSTVVPPHPQLQRDIIPEMADKQQYVTEPPCAPQPNVHHTNQLSVLYGLCYHRPRL